MADGGLLGFVENINFWDIYSYLISGVVAAGLVVATFTGELGPIVFPEASTVSPAERPPVTLFGGDLSFFVELFGFVVLYVSGYVILMAATKIEAYRGESALKRFKDLFVLRETDPDAFAHTIESRYLREAKRCFDVDFDWNTIADNHDPLKDLYIVTKNYVKQSRYRAEFEQSNANARLFLTLSLLFYVFGLLNVVMALLMERLLDMAWLLDVSTNPSWLQASRDVLSSESLFTALPLSFGDLESISIVLALLSVLYAVYVAYRMQFFTARSIDVSTQRTRRDRRWRWVRSFVRLVLVAFALVIAGILTTAYFHSMVLGADTVDLPTIIGELSIGDSLETFAFGMSLLIIAYLTYEVRCSFRSDKVNDIITCFYFDRLHERKAIRAEEPEAGE